jgi:hypothetical protein
VTEILLRSSLICDPGTLAGVPAAIVEHANFDSLFNIAEFSASAEGKLVYLAGDAATSSPLVWYDRDGKVVGTLGESDRYKNVAVSRDGSRVLTDTINVKESKIRILDSRGTRTLLTLSIVTGARLPGLLIAGKSISLLV